MQQSPDQKQATPHFDYVRSKIFGSFNRSDELSQLDIRAKIQTLFPRYESNSLLGKILDKIPFAPHPLQDLETIKKFCAILSPDDFVAFSQFSNQAGLPATKRENLDAVATIQAELAPFAEVFSNQDTKIVCIWTYSPNIEVETFSGELQTCAEKTTDTLRQLLSKACNFGIPGQTIHSVDLPDLGYRMAFSYNGWKQVRSPCILFKRLMA